MLLQGARTLWENLVNLQPQTSSSGSGISREDYISNAAADIQVCFSSMKIMFKWYSNPL